MAGNGAAAALPDPNTSHATLLCAQCFGPDGLLRLVARSLAKQPPAPLPAPFWAAGFSFSRSALLTEVPVPSSLPHLFFGEETYMLVRMWTRGWRVYAPSSPLVFHQWQRSARSHTLQADRQEDGQRQACRRQSQLKVLAVLGAGSWPAEGCEGSEVASDPEQQAASGSGPHASVSGGCHLPAGWRPGEKWGLGTEETLQEFERYVGVSFCQRHVEETAAWGGLDQKAFLQGQ